MKNDCLITFRSITFAQKAEKQLQKIGVASTLQRTPKLLSEKGCGYCLRIRGEDSLTAVGSLKGNGLAYGKIYMLGKNGHPEEWMI